MVVRTYKHRVDTRMTLWREVVWVAIVKREGYGGSSQSGIPPRGRD